MFYKLCRFICYIFILLFWSIKVEEEESINQEGSLILAANHVSYLDPIALGVVFKRHINFIAKKEIFEVPVLGLIVKSLGAIPVDRKKTNPASMRKSIELLKNGHVLGIFPEGSRSLNGELLKLNIGMIKLALSTGSPIVPVGINGTFEIFSPKSKMPAFFQRKRIYVHFGKPIYLDNKKRKDIKYQKESLFKIQEKIKELTSTARR